MTFSQFVCTCLFTGRIPRQIYNVIHSFVLLKSSIQSQTHHSLLKCTHLVHHFNPEIMKYTPDEQLHSTEYRIPSRFLCSRTYTEDLRNERNKRWVTSLKDKVKCLFFSLFCPRDFASSDELMTGWRHALLFLPERLYTPTGDCSSSTFTFIELKNKRHKVTYFLPRAFAAVPKRVMTSIGQKCGFYKGVKRTVEWK